MIREINPTIPLRRNPLVDVRRVQEHTSEASVLTLRFVSREAVPWNVWTTGLINRATALEALATFCYFERQGTLEQKPTRFAVKPNLAAFVVHALAFRLEGQTR
jgi:hypothetical protein